MSIDESEFQIALDVIAELTAQGTFVGHDGYINSGALHCYADALRYLARFGRVELIEDRGRIVIAKWRENHETPNP